MTGHRPPPVPRVLAIHGVDGTGKTTQARLLAEHLRREGRPVQEAHLRFHHRRSLPVLAVARLVGASWWETQGSHSHGVHDFRGHPRLGRAYVRTLRADMAAAVRSQVRRPLQAGSTVVMDRFVVDTVVDLSLKLGDAGFAATPAAARLFALEPDGIRRVLLDPGTADLRARRGDLGLDARRGERLELYRSLARRLGMPTVDCAAPVEDVAAAVRDALKVDG